MKVAREQFKNISLKIILPFRGTRRLQQRHRRMICLQCREYGSMLRQWPCDLPMRAASNGLQFGRIYLWWNGGTIQEMMRDEALYNYKSAHLIL